MTEIWTVVTVECAHTMPGALGVSVLHGHSYWLQFFANSPAAHPVLLKLMQGWAREVAEQIDHRNLNDVLQVPDATMEALAEHAAGLWCGAELTRVVVRRDSIGCGVEWRP